MQTIEININRLNSLLKIFSLTETDLLSNINEGRKKLFKREDIFSSKIKLSNLKKIDAIFNKGLNFYLDPSEPVETTEASIFFRKQSFNSELNIEARRVVNLFEEEKISLSAISKLSDLEFKRKLPVFTLKDKPQSVAHQMRSLLYPKFKQDFKKFLKGFIGKLAESNILVSEFVEHPRKKVKANIDGFYLYPNFIVIKRQQKYFRREIFTLAHELGHYLLNLEEIEDLDLQKVNHYPLTSIERWCHDFAYYFLAGDYAKTISDIKSVNAANDYQIEIIKEIRNNTHLSKRAIYTRLLLEKKISQKDYDLIKHREELEFNRLEEQTKKKRESQKEAGEESKWGISKPIISPLLVRTVHIAFLEGVISEAELCKKLNIKTMGLKFSPQ